MGYIAGVLSIKSRYRLLGILGTPLVAGLIIWIIVSGGSSSVSSSLVHSVIQQTSAQPRAVITESGRGSQSTLSFDRLQDESTLVLNGHLIYLQKGLDLWSRGQGCYFHSLEGGFASSHIFAQNFLPATRATYSSPRGNEIDWTLPPEGKGTQPSMGQVFFTPFSHLITAATVITSSLKETVHISYPQTVPFPPAPTLICTASTVSHKK